MSAVDLKFVAGQDGTFPWRAPGPLSGAPTLSVTHTDFGTVAPALSAVRASVAVTAVGNDKRTLTLGANIGTASRGLVGYPWGAAYLDAGEAGGFEVVVAGFTAAGTALLADPLPRHVTIGSGATLYWLTYTATLSSASVTASALRDAVWTVSYTLQRGGDAPALVLQDRGRLHVVEHPFGTGCRDLHLRQFVASLGRTLPSRQESYAEQIDLALGTLVEWVQQRLRSAGEDPYEDAVDGRTLLKAHAYLALALVFGSQAAAGADTDAIIERAETKAREAFELAIDPLPFLDRDGDGAVDSGETDVELSAMPSVAGGYFTDAQLSSDEDDGYERRTVLDER